MRGANSINERFYLSRFDRPGDQRPATYGVFAYPTMDFTIHRSSERLRKATQLGIVQRQRRWKGGWDVYPMDGVFVRSAPVGPGSTRGGACEVLVRYLERHAYGREILRKGELV